MPKQLSQHWTRIVGEEIYGAEKRLKMRYRLRWSNASTSGMRPYLKKTIVWKNN